MMAAVGWRPLTLAYTPSWSYAPSPVTEATGPVIWSSKGPTWLPSSTSRPVSAAATIWPVSASTPRCNFRPDRRLQAGRALAVTVLLDQPLAGPTQLQPCAVHRQMHGLGIAPCTGGTRPWPGHLRGGCPAAQGGVVRDREIEAEQADDGADQPFGLPVRQTEHSAERQSREDGELGIPGLATPGGARLSPPGCDCIVGEPDRQAPALAQAGVIRRPVRHLAPLSRNVVAAGLVQLEGQGGHPRSEEGRRPTPPRPQHQPPSRSVHHSRPRR